MPQDEKASPEEHGAAGSPGGAEGGAGQSPAQPQSVQGGAEGGAEDRTVQLEAQVQSLQRALADMDNRRKRAERMADERVQYAVQRLAQDLLPVIDNFERALSHAGETTDVQALSAGLKLVHDQLLQVLKRHDIQKIDALHQPFDPNHHEAIGQTESADHPDHTVVDVQQTGYQMHERTIRPSKVIISRRPADVGDGVEEQE